MKICSVVLGLSWLLGLCAPAGHAAAGVGDRLEEVVVYGRAERLIGQAASATEGIVGYDDIQLPPMLRVGELVESVPGMVATQHSGTGKANQYFIRGFNLDHGTDFAVSVEGVPVNLRTHGHGQGYLDLNFLIPELVQTTRYLRGPHSARVGDFSSAASVDFSLYESLEGAVASLTLGEHGYRRGLAAGSADLGSGTFTGAVDVGRYDGPWELDEDLEQYKLFLAYAATLGEADLRVTLQGYDSTWRATDQVPRRAVRSGAIDRLGFIDDDLGGDASRWALTARLDTERWSLQAYAVDYDFTLYSNFTYFLENPNEGDEFEQQDGRRLYGAQITSSDTDANLPGEVALHWGAQVRFDDIDDLGLYASQERRRLATVRRDRVEELSAGAWVEAQWQIAQHLRATLGLRGDWYDWDVQAFRSANSGSGSDTLLSPKLSLAWRFSDNAEAYLNYGRAFHSNDVRGATISVDPLSGDAVDDVPVLVRSTGGELGLRLEHGRTFNTTLNAFWLELDSELVYVGDAGTTEANDGSRRHGFEASLFWQATYWLALNAAWTITDARYKTDQGGGREIPGAVGQTATFGANAAWRNGLSLSMRARWLGEAPLTEDRAVHSSSSFLVNMGAAYRVGNAEWRLDVFNAFDSEDDDISYFYASRLAGEPLVGVEDVHLHPLEPRTVRVSFTWR